VTFLLEVGGQVDDRAVGDGHAHREAVELAARPGHLADRAGGTGGRRDHVDGRRARAAQILVDHVRGALVVRVGVHGRHQAALDAERVVQDLGERRQAVGRARGVRDDLVLGLQVVVVDAQHDHRVDVTLRRHGQQHLLGAGGDVLHAVVLLGEHARRLDDEVDPVVAPRQLRRIALGEALDRLLPSTVISPSPAVDGAREASVDAVVLQQVREALAVGEVGAIVDGDDFQPPRSWSDAEDETTDAAEAVDGDADGHGENVLGKRPLLVAASGGADSTALAHVVGRLHRARRLENEPVLVHLDHGQGDRTFRSSAAACVAETAWHFGLRFQLRRLDLPGRASEARMREARYDALRAIADEVGAAGVLTAHHADDDLETVLFRIARGTGPRGLAGIPRSRWIAPGLLAVRPFLDVRGEHLRRALTSAEIRWIEDPSKRGPGRQRTGGDPPGLAAEAARRPRQSPRRQPVRDRSCRARDLGRRRSRSNSTPDPTQREPGARGHRRTPSGSGGTRAAPARAGRTARGAPSTARTSHRPRSDQRVARSGRRI
jgi:tRNA(Ile)-lysidine synthetase-like protein